MKACGRRSWQPWRLMSALPRLSCRVGVLNGVAHLAGAACSLQVRAAAEEMAGKIPGVRGVVNRIEAPDAPSPGREINLDLTNSSQT